MEGRALGNIVEFVNGTRFVVDSDIDLAGDGAGEPAGAGVRVNFAFTSARLELAAGTGAFVYPLASWDSPPFSA